MDFEVCLNGFVYGSLEGISCDGYGGALDFYVSLYYIKYVKHFDFIKCEISFKLSRYLLYLDIF